jgi:carbohydrate-selective porin OprB
VPTAKTCVDEFLSGLSAHVRTGQATNKAVGTRKFVLTATIDIEKAVDTGVSAMMATNDVRGRPYANGKAVGTSIFFLAPPTYRYRLFTWKK